MSARPARPAPRTRPAPDLLGQLSQRGHVAAGQRVVQGVLQLDVGGLVTAGAAGVNVLAPSATISTPVGSLDLVDLVAQQPAELDRRVGVMVVGVDPDLRVRVRLGLRPDPAPDQRAQRHLDGLPAGLRRKPHHHVDAETREGPDAVRVDDSVCGAHPDDNPAQRQGGGGGDHRRPQLSHLVGRPTGKLGNQHRR